MSLGRIPDNILEDILSRVDIVEVVSGYIPLKRAGRNFRATCPFHHEKTPSFMVSPDRQIYHCFGCQAGGNAFNFLMQYERLEFPEAVETLARKAGVTLPQNQKQDHKTISLNTQLFKINELAVSFYESNLNSPNGVEAKKYLLKRGLTEDSIKLFKLGLAGRNWDGLINHLRNKGVNLSLLEKAGLILAKDSGGYYDRFRDRIIFPIFDIKSRALAFGARMLVQEGQAASQHNQAKYINSPETPVYVKGRNLYGLNLAKDAIRENDFVAVVEGYLDFIIPYQAGFKNIVASLGTALTIEQARLIKRHTPNVVMIYDGDDAGQIATLRTLDIFIEEGMNVKVVSLPKGVDPDLFVRKNGIDNFRENIEQSENFFDYKLRIMISRYGLKDIEAKAGISAEMLLTISRFKNAILKAEYIKKLSQELNLSEDALLQELNKIKETKDTPETYNGRGVKKAASINPTEKLLIKLMLEEEELINHIRERLEPADFQDERTSRIVSLMFDLIEQGKNIEPNKLISHFNDESLSQVICESTLMPQVPSQNKENIVNGCIQRLKDEKIKSRKQYLHEEIKAAQVLKDEEKLQSLMQEFHCLMKER